MHECMCAFVRVVLCVRVFRGLSLLLNFTNDSSELLLQEAPVARNRTFGFLLFGFYFMVIDIMFSRTDEEKSPSY